jgi:uncharacterized membrane protein YbhN (UPF0104 family)
MVSSPSARRCGPPYAGANMTTKENVIKAVVGATLCIWLIRGGHVDFRALAATPTNALHLAGVLLLIASVVVQSVRWKLLLRAQNVHMPLTHVFQLSWIAQFLSLLWFGATGGDVARAYYTMQEVPTNKVAGVSSVLVDRALGLYTLMWLSVPSFLWLVWGGYSISPLLVRMGILVCLLISSATALGVGLWVPSTRTRLLQVVPRRFRATAGAGFAVAHARRRDVLIWLALSFSGNVLILGAFVLAGGVLQTPVSWVAVLFAGPLVLLANNLPISPGGIGVAEAAAATLFGAFGITSGASLMLLVRIWTILMRAPGGVVYLYWTTHRGRPNTALIPAEPH